MKGFVLPRKMSMWVQLVTVGCVLMLSGCFPQSVPLAILPLDNPEAGELNLKGIDQYHLGKWEAALQFFQSAIQVNPALVEAYFNAGLALHQLERHNEATQYFQRAGELDPDNGSIITSTLYRNHLGLSSTLERHLSGGYRYQQEK
jgi:tetratricopeptide (TPR) repeat protein